VHAWVALDAARRGENAQPNLHYAAARIDAAEELRRGLARGTLGAGDSDRSETEIQALRTALVLAMQDRDGPSPGPTPVPPPAPTKPRVPFETGAGSEAGQTKAGPWEVHLSVWVLEARPRSEGPIKPAPGIAEPWTLWVKDGSAAPVRRTFAIEAEARRAYHTARRALRERARAERAQAAPPELDPFAGALSSDEGDAFAGALSPDASDDSDPFAGALSPDSAAEALPAGAFRRTPGPT
jgi:hypothetical protein